VLTGQVADHEEQKSIPLGGLRHPLAKNCRKAFLKVFSLLV
jgi:hypothetical protein